MINPLEQFAVSPVLANGDHAFLTVTNQTVWTGIAVAAISLLFLLGVSRMRLVPGRLQAFVELSYDFIHALTRDVAGHGALPFMPLIFTLFLFIAALNVVSLVPHSFGVTAQFATTGYMGLMVFAMVLITGFYKQGLHFLGLFVPPGTPWWLLPLITPLEVVLFCVRPFTLAVRLAANMVAGHVLLEMFAGFCMMLVGLHWLSSLAIFPMLMLIAIYMLEVFVALLQAYIFTVLTCVYLNEALHGH
jgi:F-type H+-transporting ATPase subunit a